MSGDYFNTEIQPRNQKRFETLRDENAQKQQRVHSVVTVFFYRLTLFAKVYKSKLINLSCIIEYLKIFSSAIRCAELANEKGYHYIGLQYYGECWSGVLDVKLFDGNKSEECWGYQPDYENCDDDSPTECIGTANHNYIYEVRPEGELLN